MGQKARSGPGWPPRFDSIIEGLAVTALFISFAYVGRSILGLLAPAALLLLLAARAPKGGTGLRQTLSSPFVPLIVVSIAVSFLQESLTEALQLWAFALTYVVARLARFALSPVTVLLGAAIVGFFIALLRQFSISPLVVFFPMLEKLAAVHGRNPAGTAVAFGFVGLLIVTWYLVRPRILQSVLLIWLVSTAALVLVSDVMTAVVSSGAAVIFTGGYAAFWAWRRSQSRSFLRPAFWSSGLVAAGLVAVVVGIINFMASAGASSGRNPLERDFSNLTGRRNIWDCYFEVNQSGGGRSWEQTLACVGSDHANLHNTYLQSHLIAGLPGLLFSLLAFAAAVWLSLRIIRRAQNRSEALPGIVGLGFGVLGFVFGLTESYLFVYLYPAFFVFYSAPSWDFGFARILQSLSRRRGGLDRGAQLARP